MLFYFIYLTICRKFLDLTSRDDLEYIDITMHQEETYEISIRAGFGSFFISIDGNTDFDLEVQAKNSDGNLVTYGSFTTDDRIYGIVFQTKNYTLIFKNTGKFNFDLPIYFAKNFSSLPDGYLDMVQYKRTDSFDVLDSPFIILSLGSRTVSTSLILFFSLMAVYIFLTFACRDKGQNYCKCCTKNK